MSLASVDTASVLQPVVARRGGKLRGRFRVPGDKSISHRALLISLLPVGETMIEGLLEGEDSLATPRACAMLGATVQRNRSGTWHVSGVGIGSLLPPEGELDFGNSGTGVRLMMGGAAGHPIDPTFNGDASLRRRPMRRVL